MTRPIDMQVMLPKLQSLPNARESAVNKEANALQATQLQEKKDTQKQQQVIRGTEAKEQDRLKNNKEGDGRGGSAKNGKKKKDGESEEEQQTSPYREPGHGERFDMKV